MKPEVKATHSRLWSCLEAPPTTTSRSVMVYLFAVSCVNKQGINSSSLCNLAGRYENPISTRFLAPIEYL